MDPVTLGLISGGVGLVSSLFGGAKSAKANKEAERELNKLQQQTDAFYDNRLNRDFLETNAAKGLVEQMKDRYKKQAKTIESKGEATGATAEAKIAEKTAANEQFNNGINNIAQKGTYYQLQNEVNYQNSLADMYAKRMALNRNKANNASNLAGVGAQLIGTGADIAAMGDTKSVTETLTED